MNHAQSFAAPSLLEKHVGEGNPGFRNDRYQAQLYPSGMARMDDYAMPKMQAEIARQEQALKGRYLTATPLYQHLVGA